MDKKNSRILVEIPEAVRAQIDAYQHAEEEKAGYQVSRQKVIVKLLKKGLTS